MKASPSTVPNDAVYDQQGNLYFTDPPYGLEFNMEDPAKAIPFQGVYRFSHDGTLELLLDSISRPNGLAFLPGEKGVDCPPTQILKSHIGTFTSLMRREIWKMAGFIRMPVNW